MQLTNCMTDKQKDIQNIKSEQSAGTTHILHGTQDIQNTESKQPISLTHILHDRQGKRPSEHKIRATNQYNSHTAWQISTKTFRTQNQSNQPVQLTYYMADKQTDIQNTLISEQSTSKTYVLHGRQAENIQNTKSEQLISITHILHSRQAQKHLEHNTRAINQYHSPPAWQTSSIIDILKKFRAVNLYTHKLHDNVQVAHQN